MDVEKPYNIHLSKMAVQSAQTIEFVQPLQKNSINVCIHWMRHLSDSSFQFPLKQNINNFIAAHNVTNS